MPPVTETINPAAIPLSLYIHIPWCVQKCPYCDFNSHALKNTLPEDAYVQALIAELDQYQQQADRQLISIFFGGGTPSLFSPAAIQCILDAVSNTFQFTTTIEITLEANPGTIDQRYFKEYRSAGINRLSLGIQSFNHSKLKILGRIHDGAQAQQAIRIAKEAGFDNFNLDLMFGLPEQTIDEALLDLSTALSYEPTHLSWYQLTIEPNTAFHHQPPSLPIDDDIWEMQLAGMSCLKATGYHQYEVSAYARNNKQCAHNRNYWEFGDYLGIGAGAHSKLTSAQGIERFHQVKHPRDYLNKTKPASVKYLSSSDLMFEFMLNALRLCDGFTTKLFTERTGLSLSDIKTTLDIAQRRGLLIYDEEKICPTDLGKRYLNDLVGLFL